MSLADLLARARAGEFEKLGPKPNPKQMAPPPRKPETATTPPVRPENSRTAPAGVMALPTSSTAVTDDPAKPTSHELLERAKVSVRHITNAGEAGPILANLAAAGGRLGLDIETAPLPEYAADKKAGLDPYRSSIRLVQIYAGGGTVFVFDAWRVGIERFRDVLAACPVIAHNAVFELKHLMRAGLEPSRVECTMLMANALGERLPSLADLVARRLDWDMPKDLQVSDWAASELSPDQIDYAALDAVAAFRLFDIQNQEIEERGLLRIYALMRDAQHAVARLELNGIHFDSAAHDGLMTRWKGELYDAELRCRDVLGPGINPASGKQIAGWIEAHLDAATLDRWPRTDGGQLRTDADTLGRFGNLEIVRPLLEYKIAGKNISTYGPSYAAHTNPVTGRIHASFRIAGAVTGRFSCNGPNLQNPPRDPAFRALFSAPPGRCMVVADYGQIELRVAALLSGDRAMLEAYAAGEDLHRKTAAAVAGVDIGDVTPEQRQGAKAVNFGLLYGQGAKGLAAYAQSAYGVTMAVPEATQARNAFFAAYPGLAAWQRKTAAAAERTQRVMTPGGRVRDFTLENRKSIYTESLNTPNSGGAVEILLAALGVLDTALVGYDAKLVNCVHDEIVLETAEAEVEAVQAAVEESMVAGMLIIFPDAGDVARGLVEAHSGPNWAAAK